MNRFTAEELKHIQQALKFYYEDWNKTKGVEYPTSVLSTDELNNIIRLRGIFLDEWINARK